MKDYNYQSPDKSTGIVGHFTAMIWNKTCRVGCAASGNYMVCRYKERGNVRFLTRDDPTGYNSYRENVKPPQTDITP